MRFVYATVASSAVVGALLIACSSSSPAPATNPGVDSGAKTTVADSGKGTPVDGGGSSSPSSSGTCPAPNAAAAVITWVAPGPITLGACDAADVAAFTTSWNDINQSFLQVYQAVKAPCQKCFFSTQTDTTWNTVVLAADIQSSPNDAFTNFGACYDLLYTGGGTGGAACGKGAQDDQFCLDAACPDACAGSDEGQTCFTNATGAGGECATYDSEETTGCGSDDDTLFNDCADPTVSIQTLCGNGVIAGDAGVVDGGGD